MHIANLGLTFDDVVLVPGYNGIKSRKLVSTKVQLGETEFDIPLVSSNMDTVTGFEMANFMSGQGGMAIMHRFMSIDDNVDLFAKLDNKARVGVSIGIGDKGLERAEALVSAGASIICVDVAHGHSKQVNRVVRSLKEKYQDNVMVIAGNVATYAGADYLAAAGADVIKVGIGSGSVCSTRVKTGFGVPQLTAILECKKVDRSIIADGGIRQPADAVKALAAGADFVMMGGLLSGTNQSPGEILEKTNQDGSVTKFKMFRGMASKEAQEDFMGTMADWKTAEGVSIEVPCKGCASEVLSDIMGGIRSGLTYCGASTVQDLQRKAEFMQVTPSGWIEGTPHAQLRS